jgi:tRNA nucleotidyltransferase/poly(A) polymerase
MKTTEWPPQWLLDPLLHASSGNQVWLVGGAIRDHFLQHETVDFDFVVEYEARRMAREVAKSLGGHYYELDDARDTGRVILSSEEHERLLIDFAGLREASIDEDLKERDFTINALALNIRQPEELIDPTGGLKDLKDGLLRICHPGVLLDDPIRSLRAIRLAILLELEIEAITLKEVKGAVHLLVEVSPERVRDEFFKILDLPHPGRAIRLMDHFGFITFIFPELDTLKGLSQPAPHEYTGWFHTLAVVDRLGDLVAVLSRKHDPEKSSQLALGEITYRLGRYRDAINDYLDQELSQGRHLRQLLFLGALFHDSGKPSCSEWVDGRIRFIGHERAGSKMLIQRAKAMPLSNVETRWLGNLVLQHMRPAFLEQEVKISRRATYRFLRDVHDAGVGVILLSLADLMGKQNPPVDQNTLSRRVEVARQLLEATFESEPDRYSPVPVIRGDELAHLLGIEPGPEIGQLLEMIREAQVAGEITTKSQAINFARLVRSPGSRDEPEGDA